MRATRRVSDRGQRCALTRLVDRGVRADASVEEQLYREALTRLVAHTLALEHTHVRYNTPTSELILQARPSLYYKRSMRFPRPSRSIKPLFKAL